MDVRLNSFVGVMSSTMDRMDTICVDTLIELKFGTMDYST